MNNEKILDWNKDPNSWYEKSKDPNHPASQYTDKVPSTHEIVVIEKIFRFKIKDLKLSKTDKKYIDDELNKTKLDLKSYKTTIKNLIKELELEINYEDIEEEFKKIRFEENIENNQRNVLMLLARGRKEDKREATELMVEIILKKEKIYTIRDEIKTEMWIYSNGIYLPEGISRVKGNVRIILGDAYNLSIVNEVIQKIVVDTYIDGKQFFEVKNIHKIVVENGILNMESNKIEPFNPKEFYFQKIPVSFDPSKDCPYIRKYFREVLKNGDDIQVIQELFGYLLLKDYPYEKAFMFSGSGRNGKGKTISLMKTFIGSKNVKNIPLQQLEKSEFVVNELLNKLANLSADISKTALKETGVFKALTGRDLISAQRKFLNSVDFVNYAKMIFCANELPISYDLTFAFFNRWVIIDFPYKFLTKKDYENTTDKKNVKIADEDIIGKITTKDELSGLLNWALEGLHRLLKQKGFSYSFSTEEVKKKWLRRSNSFNAFCMDCINEDYTSRIKKDELRKVYVNYCRKHKLNPSGDKIIKGVLISMFGAGEERKTDVNGDVVNCWEGISFCQGCQDCKGFSTHTIDTFSYIGSKTISTPTTLTIPYMILKLLEKNNELSTQKLSNKLNISVGEIYPILRKMSEDGDIFEPRKKDYWRLIK